MASFSALLCLPGEVLAAAAGFRAVEILPIDNDFWRFHRLQP